MRLSPGKRILAGGWLLIISLVWAGCLKSSTPPASASIEKVAYVSLMNLAAYSPATEVWLNDVKSTPAIPAGVFSTAYAHLVPDSYDVKFKVAASDSILSEIQTSAYDSLKFYTLILYNDTIGGKAKSAKILDNFSSVGITSAYYRFMHMCPEAPAVDLYLNAGKVQQARTNADILANGQNTTFQPLSPGSYSISVKKAGTDSVLCSASAPAGLVSGNAYTIILGGSVKNPADPISISILKAVY